MPSNFVSKGADGYEEFVGRWSKRPAPLFLDFVGINDGERILDVGCGTGSLTFSIAKRSDIASIEAIDFEEQFVKALRLQNNDPRIRAQKGVGWVEPLRNPSSPYEHNAQIAELMGFAKSSTHPTSLT